MAKKYDESSIKRYAGLLGIRKKPTPYIGPPDSDGLWTCWREPADNCVDQVLRGNNNSVHLIEDSQPNRYWVVDTGKGIPTGVQEFKNEHGKAEKHSTLYVVTGLTHGGANFDSDEISRGTHGIGIKATNAMAKLFTVWTCWKGQWWAIEYKDAAIHKMPYKTKAPKLPHGLKIKQGTVVMFEPDLKLFHKGTSMKASRALEWCKLTSYLVKGMEVKFTSSKGKTKTFKTAGPQQFLHDQIEELKATQTGKSFVYSDKEMDIAIGFTDAEGDNLQAYTNGLHNKEGGEHVRALQKSLYDSLLGFKEEKSTRKTTKVKKAPAKKKGKSKKDGPAFRISDLCDGLAGLVNFKIAAPQFSSQVKDKLTDDRVYPIAHKTLLEQLGEFWSKHPGMAKDVITRATMLRSKTADFLKDKKLVKNVNAAKKGMAVKLAGVIGGAPKHERELFIVEGDSAGGSAKQSRDKTFQAVYPLKGKPLNVMETAQDRINGNAEVVGLLAALGIDMSGKSKDPEPAYGKIILLADADVDGSHINTLILGVLYKFVPSLLREGRVYSVRSPLYKGNKGLDVYFGMTREEVWKNAGSKVDVTYLKGWGEVNPEDLGIALDPARRTLIQLQEADAKGKQAFQQLLGKSPLYRKQLLGVE
jgi:DNA gyrase/topoisomerase IV subunit B